jgi:hypothetical protein
LQTPYRSVFVFIRTINEIDSLYAVIITAASVIVNPKSFSFVIRDAYFCKFHFSLIHFARYLCSYSLLFGLSLFASVFNYEHFAGRGVFQLHRVTKPSLRHNSLHPRRQVTAHKLK